MRRPRFRRGLDAQETTMFGALIWLHEYAASQGITLGITTKEAVAGLSRLGKLMRDDPSEGSE